MKLGSFQNASIEIKQISFAYQQNRFNVIVVLMITDLILHYFCCLRERIAFQEQRKYFDSKSSAFETVIVQLLTDFDCPPTVSDRKCDRRQIYPYLISLENYFFGTFVQMKKINLVYYSLYHFSKF